MGMTTPATNPEMKQGLFEARYRALMPDNMTEEQFWLLIEISPMHSERIVLALRDYLLYGHSRKAACERHGVNNGYLSTCMGRLFHTSHLVAKLAPYYQQEYSNAK